MDKNPFERFPYLRRYQEDTGYNVGIIGQIQKHIIFTPHKMGIFSYLLTKAYGKNQQKTLSMNQKYQEE